MVMSTWRDKLRPASFRGVPFSVQLDDRSGGRSTVVHEYVDSDQAYPEDTGGKTPEFTITGFVIGSDYMGKRDALISALETKGSGILIHPYYGRMDVSQTSPYRVSQSAMQGGVATFVMTFIRAKAPINPVAKIDTLGKSVTAANRAMTASKNAFTKAFTVYKKASSVITGTIEIVKTAANKIAEIKNQARMVADYKRKVNNFISDVSDIINAPADLADLLVDLLAYAYGLAHDADATLDDLKEMIILIDYENDTQSQPNTEANATALRNFIQQSAVCLAVRVSADIEYGSGDDALAVQKRLADKIDSILETVSDDAIFASFQDLKAALVADITVRSANMARVQQITLPVTVSSLSLSYRLYGDIDHESEIISRNKIQHPGFLPSGVPLEVLSND
jgi:prophage DNA circulation protein